MLIKPVTIILFLCTLNKSQPQQNRSPHNDIDAYLCSSKSFIEILRRMESNVRVFLQFVINLQAFKTVAQSAINTIIHILATYKQGYHNSNIWSG